MEEGVGGHLQGAEAVLVTEALGVTNVWLGVRAAAGVGQDEVHPETESFVCGEIHGVLLVAVIAVILRCCCDRGRMGTEVTERRAADLYPGRAAPRRRCRSRGPAQSRNCWGRGDEARWPQETGPPLLPNPVRRSARAVVPAGEECG